MIKTVACLISIAIANKLHTYGSTPFLFDTSLPELASLYITESSTAERILHGVEILHFRRIPIQISHQKSGLGSPVYARIDVELVNSSDLPVVLVEAQKLSDSNNISRHGSDGCGGLVMTLSETSNFCDWLNNSSNSTSDVQSGESFSQNQLVQSLMVYIGLANGLTKTPLVSDIRVKGLLVDKPDLRYSGKPCESLEDFKRHLGRISKNKSHFLVHDLIIRKWSDLRSNRPPGILLNDFGNEVFHLVIDLPNLPPQSDRGRNDFNPSLILRGAHLKDLTLLIGPYSASSVWAMEKFQIDRDDREAWIVPLKPLLVHLNRNKPFLAPSGQTLLALAIPKHHLPSFSLQIGLSLSKTGDDELVETIERIKNFSFLIRTLLYTLLAMTSTLGMMGAVVIVVREVARQAAKKQSRNIFEREGVRLVVSDDFSTAG